MLLKISKAEFAGTVSYIFDLFSFLFVWDESVSQLGVLQSDTSTQNSFILTERLIRLQGQARPPTEQNKIWPSCFKQVRFGYCVCYFKVSIFQHLFDIKAPRRRPPKKTNA